MTLSLYPPAQAWFGAVSLLALVAFAPSPARASPPAMTEAQSIALGRSLALRSCGMCHALGRTDASSSPQAPPFRHLNQRMDLEQLGEGLATGILTSHPAMPEFRFEPHEVVAIVRYLRSVQARTRAEAAARPPVS